MGRYSCKRRFRTYQDNQHSGKDPQTSSGSAYPATPAFSVAQFLASKSTKAEPKVETIAKPDFVRIAGESAKVSSRKRKSKEANWYYENILGIDKRICTDYSRRKAYRNLLKRKDRTMINEHVAKYRRENNLDDDLKVSGVKRPRLEVEVRRGVSAMEYQSTAFVEDEMDFE